MESIGYFAVLLMGLVLGLLGSGGSILTLPILVYLFGLDPLLATSYSLVIVACAAFIGAINSFKSGQIDIKAALTFGIPSIIAVYLTRAFITPNLPLMIYGSISSSNLIMILFSLLMILSGVLMFRGKTENATVNICKNIKSIVILDGLIVGVLTGLVGAGGGFLIIPALVLVAKLDMKVAVGTSLSIIAAKSTLGFIADVRQGIMIDNIFMLKVLFFAILGIFLAQPLSRIVNATMMKRTFSYITFVLSIAILVKEII